MTIKKRLIISNIFMILIPVMICLVVGGISLIIGYNLIKTNGTGFDVENFYDSKGFVTHQIEEALASNHKQDELNRITGVLDKSQVRLVIYEDDNQIYSFGDEKSIDIRLMEYKNDEEAFLILDSRQMYRYQYDLDGITFDIILFCNTQKVSYGLFKEFIIIIFIILVAFVLLSVSLTDYFLSKFVFKKIEEPLDLLLDATHEVSSGNYNVSLQYKDDNEFKIIIDEFNIMVQQIKRASDIEREEEEKKKMLILGLGHDIKSPLTSIKGYVEGLIDGVANTKIKHDHYLNVILKKCDEISNLVNKMLSLKKIELDSNIEYESILDLTNTFINENLENYSNHNLNIKVENNLDFRLKIKKDDYFRILSNILDNSVKYASKDFIKTLIKIDGPKKMIRIEDDGVGVLKDELPHLFEEFYRTDKSRNHPEKGNGLGLSIVRDIVKNYNGVLNAYIATNGGLGIEIRFGDDTNG